MGLAVLVRRCVMRRGEPAIGHCRNGGESSIGPTAEPDLWDTVGYRGESGLGGVVLRGGCGLAAHLLRNAPEAARKPTGAERGRCSPTAPRWRPRSLRRPGPRLARRPRSHGRSRSSWLGQSTAVGCAVGCSRSSCMPPSTAMLVPVDEPLRGRLGRPRLRLPQPRTPAAREADAPRAPPVRPRVVG